MSKLLRPDFRLVPDAKLLRLLNGIVDIINGRLNAVDNLEQRVISGTTPAIIGEEFVIRHNLNRNLAGSGPNGNERGAEFIYWLNGAGTLYTGNPASWNSDSFTLACTDASRKYTVIVR